MAKKSPFYFAQPTGGSSNGSAKSRTVITPRPPSTKPELNSKSQRNNLSSVSPAFDLKNWGNVLQSIGVSLPEIQDENSESVNSRGWVEVSVTTVFDDPNLTPQQARDAWMELVWKSGSADKEGENKPKKNRRFLLPLLMEETMMSPDKDSYEYSNGYSQENYEELEYKVSQFGPFKDFESESHVGNVVFFYDENEGKVKMNWTISGLANKRKGFWEKVTQYRMNEATKKLKNYLSAPWTYSLQTRLVIDFNTVVSLALKHGLLSEKEVSLPMRQDASLELPKSAVVSYLVAKEWEEYAGKEAKKAPVIRNKWNATEIETENLLRKVVSPFFKEQVIGIEEFSDATVAEVRYNVDGLNPLKYPVYDHVGRIQFVTAGSFDYMRSRFSPAVEEDIQQVDMIWQVRIRPVARPGMTSLAKSTTEYVVSSLSQDFSAHLDELRAKSVYYRFNEPMIPSGDVLVGPTSYLPTSTRMYFTLASRLKEKIIRGQGVQIIG